MPLEVPVDDLRRDFVGCVVMHENKPVHIISVSVDGTVVYRELNSQRMEKAPFTLKAFGKPIPRIGFVNVNGAVVYVSRTPVRKYFMGVSTGNLEIKGLVGVNYEQGAAHCKARVAALCIPELGDAIMNRYPTLAEAIKNVKQFGGACAFDKQFAVADGGWVYYRGERVGTWIVDKKFENPAIIFNDNKKHLSILLDNNHEKTVRDFSPKS